MSAVYPPEYQQSPPQPPPLPAPPTRHRVRKALLIIGGAFVALILLIVVISVATSGKSTPKASPKTSAPAVPTTPTAQSYPSTASLLAAMAAHGATCSRVSLSSGGTVAGEVNPFAECSGTSDGDTAVTVFTDHASALDYANSMISLSVANSLGPTAEVVGPNWTVNTVPAFAHKVISAVGGQLITAAASPAAPTAPSVSQQVSAWFNGGGSTELNAISNDTGTLHTDLLAYAAGNMTDGTTLQADDATFQADVQAAQADLPPAGIPGLRSDYNAALTYFNTSATDLNNGVIAANAGDYNGAVADVEAGNTALNNGSAKLVVATADVNAYNNP